MSSPQVHPDLVWIALDKATGYQFEAFTQDFYSALSGARYVPLGGMKDGGADGFLEPGLSQEQGQTTMFLQASVETDFRSKIRSTIRRLKEFGREPEELIYITSQKVRHIDREERELARELNATIRIKDAAYIVAHINDSQATRLSYTHHLSHLTAFLKSVGASTLIAPSSHVKSPAVYVFLEQELARRGGDTRLVDAVTDSLILWALEGTDPDAQLFMTRDDILERIGREIPATQQIVSSRVDKRLNYLASKRYPGGRQINWHKKANTYVLPYATRSRIEDENRADEALRVDVLNSLYSRAEAINRGRLEPSDLRLASEVGLRSLQRTFEQEGLEFAHFLEDEGGGENVTVTDSIRTVLTESGVSGARGIAVGELVFEVLRKVLYDSVEVERAYLGKLSRTYTLLFTLNTEPRLIEYFQELTGELNLYVGADLLVRALSERYVPDDNQFTRRTLLMAKRLGAKLVLTDPILEEVVGNLRAADYEFRNHFEAIEAHVNDLMARNASKIMVRAYFYARLDPDRQNRPTSWPSFISQFCRFEDLHRPSAIDQLRRYLQLTYGLQYDSEGDLEAIVDQRDLQALTDSLVTVKSNETLARHDALMALAIYARRRQRREKSSVKEFGYETWWLTGESAILRYTRDLVRENHGARYIMRPDFLMNFLTLAPNVEEARRTLGHVFPSVLGIRLSRRMKEETFKQVMGRVKEASEFEDARRAAAIAEASDRLKGEFWRQYRVDTGD